MNPLSRRLPLLAVPFAAVGLAACLTSAQGAPGTDGGARHDSSSAQPTPDTGTGRDAGGRVDVEVPKTDARKGSDAHEAAAPVVDAGSDVTRPSDATPPPEGDAGSRCTMTTTQITCSQETYTITTPAGSDPEAGTTYPSYDRIVHYQVPLGTPPASGWPTVFMFQGAFLSAGLTFSATSSDAYGMYYQTELVMNLLDAGYAVLAPEVLDAGETYWLTNIAPYAADWSGSPDDVLVQRMLADVKAGTFGPLDPDSLFATGISSGGYMTSRMAVSYPAGTFRALAIESGSYATCLSGESAVTGGLCTVPTLASTHPPTLFLHGDLDTTLVPIWTVQAYEAALKTAGVANKEVDDVDSGHQWIPEAPTAVLAWFQSYP